ncbi:uncharacterized protein LOC120255504 isoform X1 [Dioscorea cayenensis subsp. rotundata]|uniref:Uncharacterized protein LOC120255504 isoform X1 n=2 Tax=Dioscorea cayennensis subsp. rotundata TaxID=55577 RepID=A0AB40AXG0_DIOCR|nr:uncharacterized protein LOC120255504 isoform X1 [Dioscorea cayenensis subsp. rotundata]XP_039119254.1 uncharacterized protein LOC120255504 isoform X1 [Dioscorea cayenensis subsp. rotundata]
MATFLRHPESTVRHDKNHVGWMWGFLHFFDFHHHLHVRKMLTDKKHTDGRHSQGTKDTNLKQNVPLSGEEHELLLSEADISMDDKVNAKIKNSASSRIKSLISKKMSKKRDKKKKTSPLASKLQRTLSIHYLECNDYVLSDELSSDSEASTVESNSCEDESCTSSGPATPMWEDFDGARQFEAYGIVSTISHAGHNQLNEIGNQFVENQVVLTEKLTQAKDAWIKLKSLKYDTKGQSADVAVYQSKDFSDMLDLFNTNKELFQQISQDPNSVFIHHLPEKHASSSEMALTKSGSFPGTALSGKKRSGLSRFKREGEGGDSGNSRESQADNSASVSSTNDNSLQHGAPRAHMQFGFLKPEHAAMNSSGTNSNLESLLASPRGFNNQMDAVAVSSRFKGLKQRIQDLIQETKKEQQRISMDGLLHKIPYGRKVSEKDERHNLWDGLAPEKAFSANSKHYSRGFRRSRSLTESLESYSRLLESVSFSEYDHKVSENVKGERHILGDGLVPEKPLSANSKHYSSSFRRSRSLTESLESYGRLLDSVSFRESTRLPEELGLVQEDPVMQNKKNPRTLGRILSNPEYGSYLQTKVLLTGDGAVNPVGSYVPKPIDSIIPEEECKETNMLSPHALASETIDGGLEEIATMNELDQNQKGISKDLVHVEEAGDGLVSVEHMLRANHGDIADGNSEKEMSVNALDQSSQPDAMDDLKGEQNSYSVINEQEVTIEEEPCNKQTKPSPISDLNSCIEEEPVCPAKYSAIEGGSELSIGGILCQAPIAHLDQDNELDVIERDTTKTQLQSAVADGDAFYVQVSKKDEAEFKYVKDLLKKSEFSGQSLPREFYSPYPEVHHSLLQKDTKCSNHDTDIATDDHEMSLDHQLRFDLINEVLADIYVRSFSYWPGFMHFNSRTRPMPTGYHILEEVWENISWHLGSQTLHASQNLDSINARDFTANDGWMNLRWDAECVALELEALLLDDLVHEAVLDYNGLLISS